MEAAGAKTQGGKAQEPRGKLGLEPRLVWFQSLRTSLCAGSFRTLALHQHASELTQGASPSSLAR